MSSYLVLKFGKKIQIFVIYVGQRQKVCNLIFHILYYYVGFPCPSHSGKIIALSLKIYPPIQGEGGGGVNEYRVYSLVIALATFSRPLLTHSSSLNGMHHSFACLVWPSLYLHPPLTVCGTLFGYRRAVSVTRGRIAKREERGLVGFGGPFCLPQMASKNELKMWCVTHEYCRPLLCLQHTMRSLSAA